jgi:hypothetical protein
MLRTSNHRASYGLTVELSGLIFVALALLWAVVLIPKALKHHDEVAKTRSVDQVSDSGRVLARREAVNEREARLVVPARTAAAEPVAEASTNESKPASVVPPQRVPVPGARLAAHRAAAKAAAKRRRRIVALLLLVTTGVGAFAATGVLLPLAPAIPAAVTVGFLVLARVLVRREHARWDAAVEEVRRPAEPAATEAPVEAPVEKVAEKVVIGPVLDTRVAPSIVSGLDETSSYDVALLRAAEAEATTDGTTLWDPLPVTLPTYVSKPRATRSVRTIDLADPRVSSSGRDAADSALVAEAATAAPRADGSAQRAVGG